MQYSDGFPACFSFRQEESSDYKICRRVVRTDCDGFSCRLPIGGLTFHGRFHFPQDNESIPIKLTTAVFVTHAFIAFLQLQGEKTTCCRRHIDLTSKAKYASMSATTGGPDFRMSNFWFTRTNTDTMINNLHLQMNSCGFL